MSPILPKKLLSNSKCYFCTNAATSGSQRSRIPVSSRAQCTNKLAPNFYIGVANKWIALCGVSFLYHRYRSPLATTIPLFFTLALASSFVHIQPNCRPMMTIQVRIRIPRAIRLLLTLMSWRRRYQTQMPRPSVHV